MPKTYPVRNSFNAGEVSELVSGARDDIQKYNSACVTLENAVPLVEGGAKKMPGTYFAGATALGGSMFTGSISGTTLTVTAVNYGVLQLGQTVAGEGVATGTILSNGGGGGGTQYSPTTPTGSVSAFANSGMMSDIESLALGVLPSISATTAILTVYVSGFIDASFGGSAMAQLQYSVNNGATWINASSYSSSFTDTVSLPISGFTNIATIKIQIVASASWIGPLAKPSTASIDVSNWFVTVGGSGGGGTGTGGTGTYTVSISQTVGSERMQTVSNGKSRLVPFQFSTVQGAILEFSAGIVRIWQGASQGQWSLGITLSTINAANYNPITAYVATNIVLYGPSNTSQNALLGLLTIAAPYGTTFQSAPPITFSVNTVDTLVVTATGTTPNQGINIALANTTPANNAATAIQAAIQALVSINSSTNNFVDLSAWTATPDPVYKASPWITVPTILSGWDADSQVVQCVANNQFDQAPVLAGALNLTYWISHSPIGPPIELVTPYTEADLFALDCSTQSADVLWVFHPSYPPAVIERLAANSWQYSLSLPGQDPGEPPYRGTLGVVKTGYSALGLSIVNINQANPCVVIISATTYVLNGGDRVYVNLVSGMENLNQGEFIVGSASGHEPVLDGNGNLSFSLNDPITGAFVDSTGFLPYAGGGFVVKVVPMFAATGDYPACGTLYQERLCVGGSDNNPTQLNGSVQADYPDFIADPNEEDFGIQFTLVGKQLNQFLNMIGTPNALLIGTAGGVWVVVGSNGSSLSQTNVDASLQSSLGVSSLEPQLVNGNAVFVSRSSRIVTFLAFNFSSNTWENNDLTRLNRSITLGASQATSGIAQTGFQMEPYPIFWAIRNDGQLIGLVFNTQDQVYAWFRINMTAEGGLIESCAVISGQNQEDQLVVVVQRLINGVVQRFVEYFMPQEIFGQLSNAFFVHCGQQLNGGVGVTITGITNANPTVVTAPAHGFTNGMTVQIAGVLGMTEINQDATEAYTVVGATTDTFQLATMDSTGFGVYAGGGTATQVFNQVTGMSYLIGNEVVAVGDGALILPPTLVTSDVVALPYFANLITIGLPYKTTIQPTNPVLSSQGATTRGMPQKINRISLSLYQSMGGKYGQDAGHMYDIDYGPGAILKKPAMSTLDSVVRDTDFDWSDESTFFVTQSDPLPFTLRGIVFRMSANQD